jgi:hypothetical protein
MLYQYRRDYKPNIEQWLELFVGKFDMDVDVIDASPQMSRFHEMHFRQLSEVILSHQSVDLADWPLQQRFTIAMMLEHRTPLDFQRITGLPMSNQLAQLSDAQMGTALHWAAKQWCEEVPIEFVCKYSYSLERLGQFEQFIVALLENNALLHSIDKHGRTPLTMMLDFTFSRRHTGFGTPTAYTKAVQYQRRFGEGYSATLAYHFRNMWPERTLYCQHAASNRTSTCDPHGKWM